MSELTIKLMRNSLTHFGMIEIAATANATMAKGNITAPATNSIKAPAPAVALWSPCTKIACTKPAIRPMSAPHPTRSNRITRADWLISLKFVLI